MEHKIYLSFLLLCISVHLALGQMVVGGDTLVGNEWIRYQQKYFKFSVEDDGLYRISKATLTQAGIPGDISGSEFRIYNMGRQVPLYVSTASAFGTEDFIEFYGYKNRSELDRYLYLRPDTDLLNPEHSLYSDRNIYFLAYEGTDIPLRTNNLINDLNNAPPVEDWYMHREEIIYNAQLNDPYFTVAGGGSVSYSSYMHSEGFCKLNENTSTTQIPALDRSPAGPDATLHLRFASTNYGVHSFTIMFNDQELDEFQLTDLRISDNTYSIPLALLQDDNQLKVIAQNPSSRHSLVSIELIYPHTATLSAPHSAFLTLTAKPGNQHLLLSGFAHQDKPLVVYTYDGGSRMEVAQDVSGNIEFVWPELMSNTKFGIFSTETGIQFISSLQEKTFTDYSTDNTEYIVITHPDLMEIGTGSEYIQYRSSPEGGGYNAKAYSILDLYDQFGYGIEKHPQAIRNFVEYFDRAWPSAKMIFIVGRAIEYNRSRYPGTWEQGFFVPTFGRPGSDQLLAATVWDLVARFPVGRLAVVNQQTIASYLEKVKEHDASRLAEQTIEAKSWIKNLMHLGGGMTAIEQDDFKIVLASLAEDLVNSDFGADVHFFQKESTDDVGQSQSARILALLNEGCGIINYLGHSASSTFEFNINDPSEWNNHGRYPIFSAMGCSAGQIHGTLFSLSDNYVQIADEGAIAFISGSGSQYQGPLINWARSWYDYIGNIGYEGTLGESILHGLRAVGNSVDPQYSGSNQNRFLLEQQTFQGDPAVRFHPMPGPDYLIDRSSVTISPNVLSTKLDSFDIRFSLVNIGRNLRQDVAYQIHIKRPDGQESQVAQSVVFSDTYESVINIRLPLDTDNKPGVFRLLISIDPDDLLHELPSPDAESNNELTDNLGVKGIEFIVVDNVVTAVYPEDFDIVTRTIPRMVATSSNSFIKHQDIVIELDTTALFNSPMRVREKFNDHPATLKWTPSVNYIPDQVYYWRVSTDSISPGQGYIWSKKSFIYKPGTSPGWNQSHFHQFTDDALERLLADSTKHDFIFGTKSRNFRIINRYHNIAQGIIPQVVEDGIIKAEFFTGFRDRNVQAFVVVIDSLTGEYLRNPPPGLYGSANHLSFATRAFPYRMDIPESRQALINLVENVAKSGDYIFFYTYQRPAYPDYYPEQWAADEITFGKSIFSMIEEQYPGSSIRTLESTGSKPYIVFFQKDRGGIVELIAADTADVISYSHDIQESLTEGRYTSTLIGPAKNWASIHHDIASTPIDTAGRNVLSAWALSADLSDTLMISSNLTSQDTNIATVDANLYPYMQLSLVTQDSVQYHPSDIKFWRVLYEGYPEMVISPDIAFSFYADTLMQGETMKLSTYVENVSEYDVDSLSVSLRIIREDNSAEELRYGINQLNANSYAPVTFEKVTSEMLGHYRLLMDINPGQMTPEVNFANNIGLIPFFVEGDRLNPVLDVTFDGHHILDGDLVASKPVIAIRLQDENQYLRLDDTSSFAIFLEFPSDLDPRQIPLSGDWVQFHPASGTGQNTATIELKPELTEDGIYTLQVKARDASGNIAGDNDYLISFEVINAESVSHLYNYPNPFSTATRFVYTLTGAGSPPYYKIQIMSLSGRVVREITQAELGPLAVGTHMTDFVWDGTDEAGGKLAAGTYLYRMIVKNEDLEDFDRYDTAKSSTFFNKGWGKLVILR